MFRFKAGNLCHISRYQPSITKRICALSNLNLNSKRNLNNPLGSRSTRVESRLFSVKTTSSRNAQILTELPPITLDSEPRDKVERFYPKSTIEQVQLQKQILKGTNKFKMFPHQASYSLMRTIDSISTNTSYRSTLLASKIIPGISNNILKNQLYFSGSSKRTITTQQTSQASAPTLNPNSESESEPKQSPLPKIKQKKGHPILYSLLALLVGGYAYDKFVMYSAVTRSVRTLFYTAVVSADYYFNFNETKTKEQLEALHERNASRLLYVCEKNGGLYIKFGQGIGLQGTILPPQFQKKLSLLFDRAPTITESELDGVLKESYPGMTVDDVFLDFSPNAIASASIAQVHKARLRSNPDQWVAVKIQKPAIRKQIELDLLIYRLWCQLVEYRFKFPIMWSVPYTEKHFRMETNFVQEGMNAELALEVIRTDPQLRSNVYVPKVFWDLSNQSVLVSEWIEGNSLVNTDALKEKGWDFKEIMGYMVKAFAQQLFVSGHLHGDPHPGNIIIRQHPDSKKRKVQVVIIDHGLYINESETFRKQYCKFWKSIFLQDSDTMTQVADGWGIQDSRFLSSMVLFRPPDSHLKRIHMKAMNSKNRPTPKPNPGSTEPNSLNNDKDISEYEKQMSRKKMAIQFFADSSKLPPELVFVMRNMNMIRSNNKSLGSPVNRIKIMANYAAFGSTIDNEVDYETNVVYKLVAKHKSTSYDEFGLQPDLELELNPSSQSQVLTKASTNANKISILSLGYISKLLMFETRKLISYWRFKLSLFVLDTIFYYTRFAAQVSSWFSGTQALPIAGNFEVVLDKAMIASLEEKLGYSIDPNMFNA